MTNCQNRERLDHSFREANEIMRLRAVSFYQAFSKLPEENFKAITAVYAYCRYADDLVDNSENVQDTLRSLQELELAVQKIFTVSQQEAVEVLTELWWPSFVHTVLKYSLDEESLRMQIQGQRMDVEFQELQTLEEFLHYCRLVAGSVGRMLVPILLNDKKTAQDLRFMSACEDLGIAMQITNILRDIGEDIRLRNRLYLPIDMVERFQVDKSELIKLSNLPIEENLKGLIPNNFISLWEYFSDLADDYYLPFRKWLSFFQPPAQFSLLLAANIYQAIAGAVREADYNCFTQRCYTNEETRNKITENTAKLLREKPFLLDKCMQSEAAYES